MLLSLALILYGLILSYCFGNLTWSVFQTWFGIDKNFQFHIALFPIIGLATMSPFIGVFHFFYKIDVLLHLFFLLLIFIYFRKSWLINGLAELKKHWFVYLILLLGASISIIIRPGTGDIADYHLQAIKWAENYPNIIGLGNFNRPLANNNWWFNLQAFFGFSWLGIKSVYVGNAIFFMSIFAWLYLSDPISKSHFWLRFVFALFVILSLKTAFVGAVTSDFIVTLMIYLLLDLYIIGSNRKENSDGVLLLSILFISWIVTVKTTAIVFFMLPFLAFIQLLIKRQFTFMFKVVLLGLVFIIPWLIGNVIVCGYLLYPFNQINLFEVDWKVPASFFEYDKVVLNSWAKVPNQDVYLTQKLTLFQWLPLWLLRLDILNKILVIGFALSAPILAALSFKNKAIIWPVLFIHLGFAIIFLNGPHPRFLFGYMVSSIAFLAYVLANSIPFNLPKKGLIYLGILLLFTLSFTNRLDQNLAHNWFHPKPYPLVKLETKSIDGFEVLIAKENGICWDQFPSSYYFIEEVKLRGESVEDGFSVK